MASPVQAGEYGLGAPVTIRTEVSRFEKDPTYARAPKGPSEERSHSRRSPLFPLPRVQWVLSGCFEYTSEGERSPSLTLRVSVVANRSRPSARGHLFVS